MNEIVDKLIPAIVGGLLVWAGTYIADRRKRRTERLETLRRAYAQWFAAETMFAMGLKSIVDVNDDISIKDGRHQEISKEVNLLLDKITPLISALNEILLLESDQLNRTTIVKMHKSFEELIGNIKYVANTYRNFHHRIEKIYENLQKNLDADGNNENLDNEKFLSEAIDIRGQVEKLPPEVMHKILGVSESIHSIAHTLRELVSLKFRE